MALLFDDYGLHIVPDDNTETEKPRDVKLGGTINWDEVFVEASGDECVLDKIKLVFTAKNKTVYYEFPLSRKDAVHISEILIAARKIAK